MLPTNFGGGRQQHLVQPRRLPESRLLLSAHDEVLPLQLWHALRVAHSANDAGASAHAAGRWEPSPKARTVQSAETQLSARQAVARRLQRRRLPVSGPTEVLPGLLRLPLPAARPARLLSCAPHRVRL